ncbi:hypothetical protein G6F22_016802 [Rhizopus arrhizus]|nr:hypothetical protein G6F22_016802 [Rhizopus arrhizus]
MQAVSGIHAQAMTQAFSDRQADALQFGLGGVAFGFGVGARMQFNHRRAGLGRRGGSRCLGGRRGRRQPRPGAGSGEVAGTPHPPGRRVCARRRHRRLGAHSVSAPVHPAWPAARGREQARGLGPDRRRVRGKSRPRRLHAAAGEHAVHGRRALCRAIQHRPHPGFHRSAVHRVGAQRAGRKPHQAPLLHRPEPGG